LPFYQKEAIVRYKMKRRKIEMEDVKMDIHKCKGRWGKVQWAVTRNGVYFDILPTLRQAKNSARWAGYKAVRRADLDYSKFAFLSK
jgi:hypothetical protein